MISNLTTTSRANCMHLINLYFGVKPLYPRMTFSNSGKSFCCLFWAHPKDCLYSGAGWRSRWIRLGFLRSTWAPVIWRMQVSGFPSTNHSTDLTFRRFPCLRPFCLHLPNPEDFSLQWSSQFQPMVFRCFWQKLLIRNNSSAYRCVRQWSQTLTMMALSIGKSKTKRKFRKWKKFLVLITFFAFANRCVRKLYKGGK